jgi:hypothetical protein
MSLEDTMNMAGQVMDIKVSDPKSTSTKLADENVAGYPCQHVKITTTYDVETKVLFMTTKAHIEQIQEIWGTAKISAKDFASLYRDRAFVTGNKELNKLIEKQASAYKNMNFILKVITEQKSTDPDSKKTTVTMSKMIVEKVEQKKIDAGVFEIPAWYTKNEMGTVKKNEGKKSKKEEKSEEINPGDILKGLF